jgi:hypothetical protein
MRVSSVSRAWDAASRPGATTGTSQGVAIHKAAVPSTTPMPTTWASAENEAQASRSLPAARCRWNMGMKTTDKIPAASRWLRKSGMTNEVQ